MSVSKRHSVHRKSLFEYLEPRSLLATISISDTTIVEGDDGLVFIDEFVHQRSGGLDDPRGVTIGPHDGHLYVASSNPAQVLKYNGYTGEFLGVFADASSAGSDPRTGDLAFGPDGDLYVSTARNNSVLRFDGKNGNFVETFVDPGSSSLNYAFGLAFGPEGDLYATSQQTSEILRFDGTTGDIIDTFIGPGSGGLSLPNSLTFGIDGHLYVGSSGTNAVLRYQGPTGVSPGSFIDSFVESGSGGLSFPPSAGLKFGPDGDLYVVSRDRNQVLVFSGTTGAALGIIGRVSDGLLAPKGLAFSDNGILFVASGSSHEIFRYGPASYVVLTVTLSTPSSLPVTVEFQTVDGSALADLDYIMTRGTLTFAPGQTTRTILVQTLDDAYREDDETFSVVLSSPSAGHKIARSIGTALIWDTDTQTAPVPGDFNGDGVVEQGDLDLVLLQWGQDADSAAPTWIGPRPSGLIDQDELDAVLLNWGTASTVARAAPAQSPLLEAATPISGQKGRLGVAPTRLPLALEARPGFHLLQSADESVLREHLFAESMKWLNPVASIKYG